LSPITTTPVPFTIRYTIDTFRLALLTEINEVTIATENFLNDYFFSGFVMATPETIFLESMTIRLEFTQTLNEPLEIIFATSFLFSPLSTAIPSNGELSDIILSAFADPTPYELVLTDRLSVDNIFSTITLFEVVL
jgi:hypothetical protein